MQQIVMVRDLSNQLVGFGFPSESDAKDFIVRHDPSGIKGYHVISS